MTLNNLARNIFEGNKEAGFWDSPRPLTETTMLVVTELAEAIEEERAGNPDQWVSPNGKPEGVDVELVDALIRLLDILGSRGVDIDAVLGSKLAYNKTRGYRHGKVY